MVGAQTGTPIEVQSEPKSRRLAITIAGAVSLGSYEAGVLYEVLEAIKQHNQDTRTVPENRIVVDVLTGASAGGMTAIILAQKLLYEGNKFIGPYNNPLYDVWVKGIDLKDLQNTANDLPTPNSLLSSNLIEQIAEKTLLARYQTLGPAPSICHHPAINPKTPLWVGVALSNLNGIDYCYRVEPQGVFEYREYADQRTRKICLTDSACDTLEFWTPLKEAAVACGAFPIAFRPKDVERSARLEPNDYPSENLARWKCDPRNFTYTDGGVLQNEPLGMAKNLVDLQDQHLNQDTRFYLFVSPHAKDDGPPNSFQAEDADFFHMVERLAAAVIGQAGFRDWIRAEGVNDRVRLMDERAAGLVKGITSRAVEVEPLQSTATALLGLLFPSDTALQSPGAKKTELRKDAEHRITAQYHFEMKSLSDIPGADIAFRDSMLAFEVAAGLGARDLMKIYGITAKASELAGAQLQAFLGFFDQTLRDHDYDVGRTHARTVLLDSALRGKGEIGPIQFDPDLNPIRPIECRFNGCTFNEVPVGIRKQFQTALQQRLRQIAIAIGKQPHLGIVPKLTALGIKYSAKFVVSLIVTWLASESKVTQKGIPILGATQRGSRELMPNHNIEEKISRDGAPKTQANDSSDSFLHSTLGAGTIITAWIFVLGWTYLHVYYSYFGININSLDFPIYDYLTFFFTQFVSFHIEGLFLGMLMLAVFSLAWFGNTVQRRMYGFLIGLGFLALFWIGFHVAETNATGAARDDMGLGSGLPQIAIEAKENHTFADGDIDVILGSSNVRLLLEDKDHLFVFIPVDLKRHPLYVQTVSIDKSDVIATLRTVRVK